LYHLLTFGPAITFSGELKYRYLFSQLAINAKRPATYEIFAKERNFISALSGIISPAKF
jgi:hypothetical protein